MSADLVSPEALKELTQKTRYSAQERFLREHYKGIVLTIRDDGSIALRQDELDRFTIGKQPKAGARRPVLDLSYLEAPR